MTESTAVAQKEETMDELLQRKATQIEAILPEHINFDRFAKSAVLSIARNPSLQKCTKASVFTAVVNAAELGLDFTPAKGLAYLVPYKNEATFMPGYRGLIQLAVNAKAAKRIDAYIVHEKDTFAIQQGSDPRIDHAPFYTGDPGKVIGAYCISIDFDGQEKITFMRKDELDAIRKRSKASGNGPWVTDYEEMCKKTVVRRHCKMLPLSPDREGDLLAKALEHDNSATGLDEGSLVDTSKSKTDALADIIASGDMSTSDAEFSDMADEQDAPPDKAAKTGKKDPELPLQ